MDRTNYRNLIKEIEEMQGDPEGRFDQRKLAIAKTHFETAMLWLSAATGQHPIFKDDES